MNVIVHEVLALDVWGNAEDGYEVNDLKTTGILVQLTSDMPDASIISAIREACGHDMDSTPYHMQDGSSLEYGFYIHDCNEKPCYFTQARRR